MITVTTAPAASRTWPTILALSVLLVLALTFAVTGEATAATVASDGSSTSLWDRIVSVGGIHWIR